MKVIGLTGGIGSGKSTVAGFLRELGARVVNADEISRELTRKGQAGYAAIRNAFGPAYFFENGELNRKKLGDLVFQNRAEKERLEGLLHPLIRKRMQEQIDECRKTLPPMLVLEVPLLIECGWKELVDEVWVVISPKYDKIKRVATRDGLSASQVEARMQNQLSDEERLAAADRVIENGGSLEETKAVVAKIFYDCVGEI